MDTSAEIYEPSRTGFGHDSDEESADHAPQWMTRVVKTFHKRRNCPKCLGTAKTDSYDMVISGIRNVTWGNKNPKTCFNSIKHGFVGVKNDPQFNTARRIQFCAAYQNLNKINNKKDWFAPSIKGLQCKKTPNQVSYVSCLLIFGGVILTQRVQHRPKSIGPLVAVNLTIAAV